MTTLPSDPYLTLGLPRDADSATIRSTYIKLARKCHPDGFVGKSLKAEATKQFHKIQEAYEIIGDQDKRAKHDEAQKLDELRERLKKEKQSSTGPPKFIVPTMNNGLRAHRARRQGVDTLEGLRGFVNGKYVVTLCDTGADENFIAEDAAREFGLDIAYLSDHNLPSFVMGNGRPIFAIGSIKAT
jgi:curved DNA-binding protein CbpA